MPKLQSAAENELLLKILVNWETTGFVIKVTSTKLNQKYWKPMSKE